LYLRTLLFITNLGNSKFHGQQKNKNDTAAPSVTRYFETTLQLSSECEHGVKPQSGHFRLLTLFKLR